MINVAHSAEDHKRRVMPLEVNAWIIDHHFGLVQKGYCKRSTDWPRRAVAQSETREEIDAKYQRVSRSR